METAVIILSVVFVVIFIMVGVIRGFLIIPQKEAVVIERLGKYYKTLKEGMHVIWPMIEKPREFHWKYRITDDEEKLRKGYPMTSKIDLREQIYDFPKQKVITKDDIITVIDALLYFQIIIPEKAVYETANLPEAIEQLTKTTLRDVFGGLKLNECLASRKRINQMLHVSIDETCEKWGIRVNRVVIKEINPPADIRDAMEKEMRAEQEKKAQLLQAEAQGEARIREAKGIRAAAILKAQGEKQAAITKAEGEKQAAILRAQSEREKSILHAEGKAVGKLRMLMAETEIIEEIAQSISKTKGDSVHYLLTLRNLETLRDMIAGGDKKVIYLPYETSGILSSIGALKDIASTSMDGVKQ